MGKLFSNTLEVGKHEKRVIMGFNWLGKHRDLVSEIPKTIMSFDTREFFAIQGLPKFQQNTFPPNLFFCKKATKATCFFPTSHLIRL